RCEMRGANTGTEERDDVAALAVARDPRLVLLGRHGGDAKVEPQLTGSFRELTLAFFVACLDLDQEAQVQGAMNDGLADIQDAGVVIVHHQSELVDDARVVAAGGLYQEDRHGFGSEWGTGDEFRRSRCLYIPNSRPVARARGESAEVGNAGVAP